jgi:hypothetical protein
MNVTRSGSFYLKTVLLFQIDAPVPLMRDVAVLPSLGPYSTDGISLNSRRFYFSLPSMGFALFFKFVYSHVHTLFGPFLPPSPTPSSPPNILSLLGRNCSALISIFIEEKT